MVSDYPGTSPLWLNFSIFFSFSKRKYFYPNSFQIFFHGGMNPSIWIFVPNISGSRPGLRLYLANLCRQYYYENTYVTSPHHDDNREFYQNCEHFGPQKYLEKRLILYDPLSIPKFLLSQMYQSTLGNSNYILKF